MATPISALHQAARDYALAGVPVFPCAVGQKRPACAHGWKDATTDLATIGAWWAEADYNLAIYPEGAGWCIVDLDGEEGLANWRALCAEHGTPETYVVRTPSGGEHWYFEGSLPPTVAKLAKGIDTRGVASYVLIPPSSVDGGTYEILCDNDLAACPAWLLSLVRETTRLQTAADADSGIGLDLSANVERGRQLLARYADQGHVPGREEPFDDYAVCCEILNLGLSQEKALELALEHWAPYPHSLDLVEFLRTTFANAAEYAQNEQGAWAVPPAAELWPDAGALSPRPTRSRFYPYDWKEQAAMPEPTWLFPDFIPADSTVMFYGQPGSFKSFLALDVALTIASGISRFGRDCQDPADTVYIAGEGPRGISRLRAPAWVNVVQPSCVPHFYLVADMPWIGQPEMLPQFIEAVESRQLHPKLIVLDTAALAMTGMNENDAKDAGLFVAAVNALKNKFACTVLVVHHSGKEDARGARGSSALMAGFDAVYEVKAHEGTKAVSLHCRKQKDADKRETPLTFEGKTVGASLVFFETDAVTHRILVAQEDRFEPKKIGAFLVELDAYGIDNAVTTHALATQICKTTPDETGATAKGLKAIAGSRLVAYATKHGRDWLWNVQAKSA